MSRNSTPRLVSNPKNSSKSGFIVTKRLLPHSLADGEPLIGGQREPLPQVLSLSVIEVFADVNLALHK